MKIVAITALGLWLTGLAGAQVTQGPGANKRPKADFGWQSRQQEAIETREKLLDQLNGMSDEEWKQATLAQMAFSSDDHELSFIDPVRIGAVTADRKAVTREIHNSVEASSAWAVTFGRKTPKFLTLTLTDGASTKVQCEVGQLLEAGEGYVGIVQTAFELLCLVRPRHTG